MLERHGAGLLLGYVPNHLRIASRRNRWRQDVLENGQSSEFATCFEIAWQPIKSELKNLGLLPFLGDHYGMVLENGERELRFEVGAFTIW